MFDDFCRRARIVVDEIPERAKSPVAAIVSVFGMIALGGILVVIAPSPRNDSTTKLEASGSKAEAAAGEILEPTSAVLESVSKRAIAEPQSQLLQPNPPADDPLALRLFSDFPELNPQSDSFQRLTDWERVVRLRDFSYRHTAFAGVPCQDARRSGAEMMRKLKEGKATLADVYQFFDEARGGVSCKEAAELLRLLCTWAGFEAEYLEIGVPSRQELRRPETHALTLVRINVRGNTAQLRSILSVHDPSVNLSYGDSQHNPIDYFAMLELLLRQQAKEIHFIGEVLGSSRRGAPITVATKLDLDRTRPSDFAQLWSLPAVPIWSANSQGQWCVRAPRRIWAFEQFGESTWKSDLFGAGYPPETIYLHCFPIEIRGTVNSSTVFQRAQAILGTLKVAADHAQRRDL